MKKIYLYLILTLIIGHSDAQIYLLLNSPAHADTVHNLRPDFSWDALSVDNRTSFGIKVCKVELGQTIEQAIMNNVPIINNLVLSNFCSFPIHLNELDSASCYAWQIVQLTDGIPITVSNLNKFYTPYPIIYRGRYWKLTNAHDKRYFINDRLTISYNIFIESPQTRISIIDANTKDIKYKSVYALRKGDISIDLEKSLNINLEFNKVYQVVIENLAGKNYKFIYKKINI